MSIGGFGLNKVLMSGRNLLIPAIIHLLIIGIYSTIDPCNNNPGCMAGTLTVYFMMLFTGPTLIILLIANLMQCSLYSEKYSKYLVINISISLFPYVLAGGIYVLSVIT